MQLIECIVQHPQIKLVDRPSKVETNLRPRNFSPLLSAAPNLRFPRDFVFFLTLMDASPGRIVSVAAATYSCIFAASSLSSWPTDNSRANLKAISSLHSVATTAIGLAALLDVWPVEEEPAGSSVHASSNKYLDDSRNPLIVGRSSLGNAVTSFETGYILYDNIALLLVTRSELQNAANPSTGAALSHLLRKEPLLVIHHLGILTGLCILQTYIAQRRERGIWIIVAFILMRASDPILHWRWWRRKQTGRPDARLDMLLAAVFAVCRFGTVGWVLRAYGDYHNMGPWQAFLKQRVICKAGTGMLVGLNALWLTTLLRNTGRRLLRRKC